MSTEFYNTQWQMPNEANKSKQTNYSLNFGGSQYISSSPTLSGLTEITVSCWAKFENINNNDFQYVLNAYNTNQSNAYRLGIAMIKSNFATTSDRYKLYTIDGPNLNISSFVVTQDVWYNIVVTHSGGERKLYVNGNLISTFTVPALNLGNNFEIGRFQNTPHYFNGKINEICIFDYAFSASQVTTLYGTGSAMGDPMSLSPAPKAYYQLSNSVWNGSNYITPNSAVQDYVFEIESGDGIDTGVINLGYQFTVSFWLQRTVTGEYRLFNITDSAGAYSTKYLVDIVYPGSNQVFSHITDTSSFQSIVDSNIPLNSWIHCAYTRNGRDSNVYLSYNGAFNQNSGANSMQFPSGQETTNTYIVDLIEAIPGDGFLSNVNYFTSILTLSEIETLYNNGSPIKNLANIPQSSNLKAWYKLDASEIYNSVSTEWSIDNNATPTAFKSSLSFDGNNDVIDIPNSSVFDLGTSFTISGWFNVTSYVANMGYISFDSSTRGWFLFHQGTNLAIFDGTSVITLNSNLQPTNQWNSYIITYDGTDLIFYLNGQQNSTQAVSINLQTNGNDGQIGNQQFQAGRFYNGYISNVAIYNTALSAPNVATLYNNGTPQATIYGSPVAHWKLDNTTTGIQDSAGSNNGTNNGATEYPGFVNKLAGDSSGMSRSNLIQNNLSRVFNNNALSLSPGTVPSTASYSQTLSGFYPSSGNFTFSVWLRNTSTGKGGIFSKGTSFQASEFGLAIAGTGGNFTTAGSSDNGKLIFMFDTASAPSSTYLATSEVLESGKWYNFVATYTPGDLKLYLNGSLDNSTTSITKNSFVDQRVKINNCLVNGWNWGGRASNWAFFDTVLSATEVREIWNNGLPGDLKSHSKAANLKNWLKGAKGAGDDVLLDYVGPLGITGSYTNGPNISSGFTDLQGASSGFSAPSNTVTNIVSDAPYSDNNAISYNMQSTNSGGVSNTWTTPTSGRTTDTPQAT